MSTGSTGKKTRITGSNYSDLIYEADITVNSGSGAAGIFFRATNIAAGHDNYSGYFAFIDANYHYVGLARGPGYNVIGSAPAPGLATGVRYKLSVIAVKERIRVFVDGALYIDVDDATWTSGAVGLTSHTANVSFDNVMVSSEPPGAQRETFTFNVGNWIEYDNPASFEPVLPDAYKVVANSFGAKTILSNSESCDYIIHADMTLNTLSDAGILFRVENPGPGADNYNGYYASINGGTVSLSKGPGFSIIASSTVSYTTGKTYHLKIETLGPSIKFWVDGVLKINATDNTYRLGTIGLTSYAAEAIFDNVAVNSNVAAGLAMRDASGKGFWGTPKDWSVRSYYHNSYSPFLSDMAARFLTKFRETAFGWNYSSSDGGGSAFEYQDFIGAATPIRDKNLVAVVTHGNDGRFIDWDGNHIYIRNGYSPQTELSGENRFLVIIGCATLWTGVAPPHNATGYLGSFKGAHAILSYSASFLFYQNTNMLTNLVDYFVTNWHANKQTGIYPAFREATFKATYYDNDYQLGQAPAVVFTAGSMYGQLDYAGPYEGWEEKTWNMYNGAAYITEAQQQVYGYDGEVLIYNPNWGYPDKIGHKYSTVGSPDWSDILPLP